MKREHVEDRCVLRLNRCLIGGDASGSVLCHPLLEMDASANTLTAGYPDGAVYEGNPPQNRNYSSISVARYKRRWRPIYHDHFISDEGTTVICELVTGCGSKWANNFKASLSVRTPVK